MITTVVHGERETLIYAVDEDEPETEQPAIRATLSTRPLDPRRMTTAEIKQELESLAVFKWTHDYYANAPPKQMVEKRENALVRRQRQLEYCVAPLIYDDAIRAQYEYDVTESDALMRRFPNIVAHIIAESLGYATPRHAAIILQHAILGDPDFCEWIDACYHNNPVTPVKFAICNRHRHSGYMSSFKLARKLVQEYLDHKTEPMLASWF